MFNCERSRGLAGERETIDLLGLLCFPFVGLSVFTISNIHGFDLMIISNIHGFDGMMRRLVRSFFKFL